MTEERRDAMGRRLPDAVRSYAPEEKAKAVGLAMTIGDEAAAQQLGIPKRNLSRWRRSTSPVLQGAIVASQEAISANVKAAATEGSAWLLSIIRDPKTPARVKVDAIELALEQEALNAGRATARTETTVSRQPELTWDEAEQLRKFTDAIDAASDEELQQWGSTGLLKDIQTARRAAAEHQEDTDDVG